MRYLKTGGGRRGQLLILVLGVMALGLFVVAPLLAYVDQSFKINMKYQIKSESYLAAEAGVERVIGDLYMGTDIRVPGYDAASSSVNNAPAVLGDMHFSINVTEPTTLGAPPLAVESYLDPGSCLGMRPIEAGDFWDYDFFMSHGEDIKVNWVYYVAFDTCNPDDDTGIEYGWSVISLLDEDLAPVLDREGNPIRSEVCAPGVGPNMGDEARMVVNTLFVQGAYPGLDGERGTADDDVVIQAGPYVLRFENKAYRGAVGTNVRVCTPPFKGGDYDHVFNGSINCSEVDCGHFIDDGTYVGLGAVMLLVFNEDHGDVAGEINTDTFSCDYVQLNITTWDGNVSTYTFNNSDPMWGPHFSAYDFTVTDPGGPDVGGYREAAYDEGVYDELVTQEFIGGGIGGGIALGGLDVEAISHREGERFDMLSAVTPDINAVLMHVFFINESSADVARIDAVWEGYQHVRAETADASFNDQADDDELALFIANWDPAGDPTGAGMPVMHYLDRRQQGAGFVWVKLYQGAYRDYLVTSTAYRDKPLGIDGQMDPGEELAVVSVYLRQSPGPSVWWEKQSMEILSWNIDYYAQ